METFVPRDMLGTNVYKMLRSDIPTQILREIETRINGQLTSLLQTWAEFSEKATLRPCSAEQAGV